MDFADQAGLLSILLSIRITHYQTKTADISNFLAEYYPQFSHLRHAISNKSHPRIREDEFHLMLMHWFNRFEKYTVHHHVELDSGKIVDLIVTETNYSKSLVIECKVDLSSTSLYTAIGQALAYTAELGQKYPDESFLPMVIVPITEYSEYADKTTSSIGLGLAFFDIATKTFHQRLNRTYPLNS